MTAFAKTKVDATGVPQTCPLIDEIKSALQNIENYAKSIGRNSSDAKSVEDLANSIRYEISGLEDRLETIRRHNSDLRDFGLDLEALVSSFHEDATTVLRRYAN